MSVAILTVKQNLLKVSMVTQLFHIVTLRVHLVLSLTAPHSDLFFELHNVIAFKQAGTLLQPCYNLKTISSVLLC